MPYSEKRFYLDTFEEIFANLSELQNVDASCRSFKNWAATDPPRVSAEMGAQLPGASGVRCWLLPREGCRRCATILGAVISSYLSLKDSLQNLSFHFLGLQVLGARPPWGLRSCGRRKMVYSGILTLRQPYRDDDDSSNASARTVEWLV
jgi:hypothetical protein